MRQTNHDNNISRYSDRTLRNQNSSPSIVANSGCDDMYWTHTDNAPLHSKTKTMSKAKGAAPPNLPDQLQTVAQKDPNTTGHQAVDTRGINASQWYFTMDVRYAKGIESDWLRMELVGAIRDLLAWSISNSDTTTYNRPQDERHAA